jgi:hypothetical protein
MYLRAESQKGFLPPASHWEARPPIRYVVLCHVSMSIVSIVFPIAVTIARTSIIVIDGGCGSIGRGRVTATHEKGGVILFIIRQTSIWQKGGGNVCAVKEKVQVPYPTYCLVPLRPGGKATTPFGYMDCQTDTSRLALYMY